MARHPSQTGRFSIDGESTFRDIWQLSDMPGSQVEPQNVDTAMAVKRQIRKESRVSDRMSISQYLNDGTPPVRDTEVSRAMRRRSANINMHKSIQALDEAVGTPGSFLHGSQKTPSRYRSAYTPMRGRPDESLDVSSLFAPSAAYSGSVADLTKPALPDNHMLDDDVTSTNVALLLEEDPGTAACTGLFTDFSAALRTHEAGHQVFPLVLKYNQTCHDNVEQLNKLVKSAVPGQTKFAKTLAILNQLTLESSTWSLVASLYRDRMEHDLNSERDEPMVIDNLGKYQSEKDLVENFFEKDSQVRQAQLVVDWLEQNCRERFEVYSRVEFFTDGMGAWENTHHQLKQKRTGHTTGSDRPVVTELDPDAPIREGRPLADLDVEDESRLLKHMFGYIRAGKLEDAQELCVRVGQAWRAATLEGWRLYHDPNYAGLGQDGRVHKVEGNPRRDLWKAVCWNMADEEQLDMYERAIYAALSGNLRRVLAVCSTWQDQLWAYFKVLVDQLTEREVRLCGGGGSRADLPQHYWENTLSVEKIFNDIQASNNMDVQHESKAYFNVIQKYIILGDTDRLIEEMYEWIKDETNFPSQHLLRFMAHLVLFFRAIGICTKDELCVSILEAYVRYLIEDKHTHLVATYVYTLPQRIQVEWYAKFLEGIEDTEERRMCLQLAEEAGLDLPSITKLVVENIRKRDSDYGDGDMPSEVATTKEDRQKIDAIDWLVFDPAQRAEALRQANALMITFLAVRKLSAAREVFNKIPAGSIDVIIKTWTMQTGSTELRAEDDNAVREYLCHQAYLDAHDSFNDWFEHFHHAAPAKPVIPAGANFTERVAFEHKEKQYEMDLARWKHNLMNQTKVTQDKIYNVLLFVDGGWMVDKRTDGEWDRHRTHQMRLLRQLCLPTMCFLLHTVLHSTEQYRESLRLADVIVSDQHELYKTFRRDELQQLLVKLRESSLSLLNSNLDPLGYSLTDVSPEPNVS